MKAPTRQKIHNRLRKGWSEQDARNTPTDPEFETIRRRSRLWGKERGKGRTFRFPKEWEPILDQAIEESGLTTNDYLAELVATHLGLLSDQWTGNSYQWKTLTANW